MIGNGESEVLVFTKCGERYVMLFPATQQGRAEALRYLGRWAVSPELIFTWHDAAVLSEKIRKGVGQKMTSRIG